MVDLAYGGLLDDHHDVDPRLLAQAIMDLKDDLFGSMWVSRKARTSNGKSKHNFSPPAVRKRWKWSLMLLWGKFCSIDFKVYMLIIQIIVKFLIIRHKNTKGGFMLIQFSVGNFRSFKERATLSMVAANTNARDPLINKNNTITINDNLTLLTSTAIYGRMPAGRAMWYKPWHLCVTLLYHRQKSLKLVNR